MTDLDAFWGSLWDYFDIQASQPFERVLGRRAMPGAEWFPGARLNYAEHALRHERDGAEALLYLSERQESEVVELDRARRPGARLATYLRSCGLKPGDRVVAYLPNSPEAVIAMLATVSIGAIWASCGPDFGARGVVDRFSQLAPKLAFCVDGYYYGGKPFDRRPNSCTILGELPSLERVIYLRRLDPADPATLSANTMFWEEALAGPRSAAWRHSVRAGAVRASAVDPVLLGHHRFAEADRPLPRRHHARAVQERSRSTWTCMPGERMFFFTTTGWMMWNFLVSALMLDVVPVLYDGNPAYPEPDVLWQHGRADGREFLRRQPDLSSAFSRRPVSFRRIASIWARSNRCMLAGSPVTAECMAWFYRCVKADVWAHSGSGGTDLCTGIVGGVVTLPIYAGEIQARQLGVAAYAFDERGEAVVDEVGELVITQPLPSMPVGFWNDADGSRYRDSYFDQYPGVWRHGDFFKVNARGGCFVLGRSDATLNRHGVRIGTAEVYRSLLDVPEIEDSLIVNLDLPGGRFFMPLFVKLRDGHALDARAQGARSASRMRNDYSPRHVPDKIYQVDAIPYTLTGKKMEVPVRRILMGMSPEKAANRAAMANVESLDYFIDYARTQTQRLLSG